MGIERFGVHWSAENTEDILCWEVHRWNNGDSIATDLKIRFVPLNVRFLLICGPCSRMFDSVDAALHTAAYLCGDNTVADRFKLSEMGLSNPTVRRGALTWSISYSGPQISEMGGHNVLLDGESTLYDIARRGMGDFTARYLKRPDDGPTYKMPIIKTETLDSALEAIADFHELKSGRGPVGMWA